MYPSRYHFNDEQLAQIIEQRLALVYTDEDFSWIELHVTLPDNFWFNYKELFNLPLDFMV